MPDFPAIYQDEHLVVLNKPSGLLVHRGWAQDTVTALSVARSLAGRYVFPVHRLDRSASGVLLFTTSGDLARRMQEALQAGQWRKHYIALVRGIVSERGVIDYPLAKERGAERRPALSRFARLGTFERYSLVLVEPLTGRLHQIRKHFRHESHPLIGDVRYGKAEHNRLFRARFGLHRLCLHASTLEVLHPVSHEALRLKAPLPNDLSAPFAALGLEEAAERDDATLPDWPAHRSCASEAPAS